MEASVAHALGEHLSIYAPTTFKQVTGETIPLYNHIPVSWTPGVYYLTSWGVKYSWGAGVKVFSKLYVNDELWWTGRHTTPTPISYYHYGHGHYKLVMLNSGMNTRIELGRTINGKDIIEVFYERHTVPEDKPGKGEGSERILSWSLRPDLYKNIPSVPTYAINLIMLVREVTAGTTQRHRVYDLDTGETIFSGEAFTPQSGGLYPLWLGFPLEKPYGKQKLRFVIEPPEGKIFDYFDLPSHPPPNSLLIGLPFITGLTLVVLSQTTEK